jgi:glycosidase
VAYCDRGTNRLGSTNFIGTINVMLDGVFNHTSWDAEFGEMGVELGFCANKDVKIGTVKPGWYANWQDYGEPATYWTTAWSNDIATAPDRGDFGKWADVAELYYGKYSALVRHNPDNNGDYLNEQDVYDFAGMSADTIDLWRYVGRYTEYWLEKTGHSLTNRPGQVDAHGIAYDDYGIDGLRCDFGQGLPPQLWEYIINRTRSHEVELHVHGRDARRRRAGLPLEPAFRHPERRTWCSSSRRRTSSDPGTCARSWKTAARAYNGGAILLNLTATTKSCPGAIRG